MRLAWGGHHWEVSGSFTVAGAELDGGILELVSEEHRRVILTEEFLGNRCELRESQLIFPPDQFEGRVRALMLDRKRVPLGRIVFDGLDQLRVAASNDVILHVLDHHVVVPPLPSYGAVNRLELFLEDQINRADSWPIPVTDGVVHIVAQDGRFGVIGYGVNSKHVGMGTLELGGSLPSVHWNVELPGKQGLDVFVVDAFMRPLSRHIVTVEAGIARNGDIDPTFVYIGRGVTGEDGRAELRGLPSGRLRLSVRTARALGRQRVSRILSLPSPPLVLEVPEITCTYLVPTLLSGEVSTGSADVYVRSSDSDVWRRFTVRPTHQSYYIVGLAPQTHEFCVRAEGCIGRFVHDIRATTTAQPLRCELPAAAVASGVVRSQGGEPLPGVRVECLDHKNGGRSPFDWEHCVTDKDGRFSIVAETTRANYIRFVSGESEEVVSWSEELEITLSR